jgi:methyl-accepting chemotaxis protein WspA
LEETIAQRLSESVALKNELKDRGDQMQTLLHQMVDLSQQSIEQATMYSQIAILAGFLIGTLALSLIGIGIIRSTRKSLQAIIAEFKALVAGESDLTRRLHSMSQDELGQLSRLFNQFIEQLQVLVNVIRMSSLKITSSTAELSAMAKQQDATLTHQVEATHRAADRIQAVSQDVTALTEVMNQVAATTQTTADFANSGQTDLVRLEETFHLLEAASQTISQKLEAIHQKAGNITGIVTTIHNVADQTNLLSLNAAIEAEKAREFGRGFTVVAREIRRLADQTATATSDIGQMVQEMQHAVSVGVAEMEKFLSIVRSGAHNVGNISEQLLAFIDHVRALSPRFDEINTAMLHESSDAQNIQTSMLHLRESIEEIKTSLHETYTAIYQLNETAHDLQEQVERFKLA